MPPLVLFDLGDTLIFREKPLMDFDVELLEKFSGIEKEKVSNVIRKNALINQGIYQFSMGGVRIEEEETKNIHDFFEKVFGELALPIVGLGDFLEEREAEVRYKVFPRVEEMLALLKSRGYILGVASNGRPSRRAVLNQLGLKQYFDPDQIYISDEIGLCKPKVEFFEYIEKKSGFEKFVLGDDEKPVLETAAAQGWTVIETGPEKDVYNEVLSILN